VSLHYLLLAKHVAFASSVHSFKFEVLYTLAMLLFVTFNSNINIYNSYNNKMRRCKPSFMRVSHASLHKRLIKTMECTSKRVTKVTITENEICKSKIQHEKATIQLSSCSKCCPLSQTCVLSLATSDPRPCRCASVQPWRTWGAEL